MKLAYWLTSILLSLLIPAQAAVWDVVYPRLAIDTDKRNEYPIAMLKLALEQTGVKYQLRESSSRMDQGKSVKSLMANREINVLWSMTDSNREAQLLPIRIPIFKGLIGLRLFLIKPANAIDLQRVSSLANLRDFTLVQGRDWPDTKILQANGFEVMTAPYYPGLFELLKQDRAELFPRSIVEIWPELTGQQADFPMQIADNIAVYYPTAIYFFVNKKNLILANVIRSGMEKALANGEFDKLFYKKYQPLIEKAKLSKRTIFKLNNPILPKLTPLERKALWYPIEGMAE